MLATSFTWSFRRRRRWCGPEVRPNRNLPFPKTHESSTLTLWPPKIHEGSKISQKTLTGFQRLFCLTSCFCFWTSCKNPPPSGFLYQTLPAVEELNEKRKKWSTCYPKKSGCFPMGFCSLGKEHHVTHRSSEESSSLIYLFFFQKIRSIYN